MRKIQDQEAHFWSRVNVTPGGNHCWNWTGPIGNWGYGRTKYRGIKTGITSRLAWIFTNGVVPPDGILVCHHCDNPACCRPDHLFLGTSLDNATDRDAKGRTGSTPGELHGMAKLKEGDIHEIRRLRKSGAYLKDIGKQFDISLQMVWYIAKGKNWAHVKESELVVG